MSASRTSSPIAPWLCGGSSPWPQLSGCISTQGSPGSDYAFSTLAGELCLVQSNHLGVALVALVVCVCFPRSTIPLLSKFLFIQDMWALGTCSHACHAVVQLGICWTEINFLQYVDKSRFYKRCKQLVYPPSHDESVDGLMPITIARPYPVPMVGHCIRAVAFRNVRLTDDVLARLLLACPALTSLDLEALAAQEHLVTLGVDTIAMLGKRYPTLGRLRLVYPGLKELPPAIALLKHLTKLVVGAYPHGGVPQWKGGYRIVLEVFSLFHLFPTLTDSDSLLTPPGEVSTASVQASVSFLEDLTGDGDGSLMFLNVRLITLPLLWRQL